MPSHLHLLPLAGLTDFDFNRLIVFAIPIVAIIAGGTIAIVGMYLNHRRRELWHETARVALEKGQPLPPTELEDVGKLVESSRSHGGERQAVSNDFRGGLVLIGVGAGLYLFFDTMVPPVRFAAAIPGFIGVALVLHGLLNVIFSRKNSAPEDRRPQP